MKGEWDWEDEDYSQEFKHKYPLRRFPVVYHSAKDVKIHHIIPLPFFIKGITKQAKIRNNTKINEIWSYISEQKLKDYYSYLPNIEVVAKDYEPTTICKDEKDCKKKRFVCMNLASHFENEELLMECLEINTRHMKK